MNRSWQYLNLFGVLTLGVLCAAQWRANREANLEVVLLERARLEQDAKLEQQAKTIQGLSADLEAFRERLAGGSATLKEVETKLQAAQREIAQLGNERGQLRASVTNWANATAARDQKLKEAGDQLRALAAERNEVVAKFNDLAAKYGTMVNDLNTRTKEYNALVERFNALAKSTKGGSAE